MRVRYNKFGNFGKTFERTSLRRPTQKQVALVKVSNKTLAAINYAIEHYNPDDNQRKWLNIFKNQLDSNRHLSKRQEVVLTNILNSLVTKRDSVKK